MPEPTAAVTVKPTVNSITNPVPGDWMQPADRSIPPVYIPHERVTTRDETGRDHVQYVQSPHVKRLLTEGGSFVSGPVQQSMREQSLEEALAVKERELEELRARLNAGVPPIAVESKPASKGK